MGTEVFRLNREFLPRNPRPIAECTCIAGIFRKCRLTCNEKTKEDFTRCQLWSSEQYCREEARTRTDWPLDSFGSAAQRSIAKARLYYLLHGEVKVRCRVLYYNGAIFAAWLDSSWDPVTLLVIVSRANNCLVKFDQLSWKKKKEKEKDKFYRNIDGVIIILRETQCSCCGSFIRAKLYKAKSFVLRKGRTLKLNRIAPRRSVPRCGKTQERRETKIWTLQERS